jgi:HK97 family phage prohead protease
MTTLQRFYVGAAVEPIGPYGFRGVAADDSMGLDGNIWRMAGGLDYESSFGGNPIGFRNHNPNEPVCTYTRVGFSADGHQLLVEGLFPEPGVSAIADETRALLKAGVLRGLSCGIDAIEVEPLDAKKGPRGGILVKRSRLLEISIVGVPASPGALVTQRSAASRAAFMAAVSALPTMSQSALTRAAAQFAKQTDVRPPATAAITVWGLLEARRLDEEASRAALPARQRLVEELRARGRRQRD